MKDPTILSEGCTVGLDLGDQYSQYCVLARDGQVVQEGRIRTTAEHIRRCFSFPEPCRIALEVGTHSPWVSRLLKELGHEVIVANARKLRLIYENDDKSDQVDAGYLARLARLDPKLLAPLNHRGAVAQADLAILRSRDALVGARTKLVNHARGVVKSLGARLRSCSTHAFGKKVREDVPEASKAALTGVLDMIEELTSRIAQYDRTIEGLAAKYPESSRLQQVPGVGPLTSMAFILTLEDPARFEKSRTVGSFVGLRPRKKESGERAPQLGISKAGDTFVRRLLVGSAQYILGVFGPDSDLRRWGLALARRGGKNAKKRAVVAVARKLAVLLHRLWVSGEPYDPLRNTRRQKSQAVAG